MIYSKHLRLLVILMIFFVSYNQGHSQQLNKNQQIVWELEGQYWELQKNGDVENFLKLWHEDFVGWPCGTVKPADKTWIENYIKRISENERWTYLPKLHLESIEEYDDVVIVYYSSIGKNTLNFIHTWKKVEKSYQIIGGMCRVVMSNSNDN